MRKTNHAGGQVLKLREFQFIIIFLRQQERKGCWAVSDWEALEEAGISIAVSKDS